MAGEKQLSDGRPAGTLLGQSATDLVGMHGQAPSDQAAAITSVGTAAAISTTGATYGFATSTQATALVTAVNSILAALREKGFIAS